MMSMWEPIANLSRRFLCNMLTIIMRIHVTADASEYRFCQEEFPEDAKNFLADMRRDFPQLREYEMNIKRIERND